MKPLIRGALILAGLLGLTPSPRAWADSTVWLSSLDLRHMSSGWGQSRTNQSVQQKPLSIGGHLFERGVGTHAPSVLYVDLKGRGAKFTAAVGVDDEVKGQRASVRFRVYGDGKPLWDSGTMKAGEPAKPVAVSLEGIRLLLLLVGDAGDGIEFDHADWAEAQLEMRDAGVPEALAAPVEKPYLLTPRPLPQPRIHGPKVFGVRPGSPFLYTIPATGEHPLSFAADGLPDGLKVDRNSGQITGVLKQRGDYLVTLKAQNSLGSATRLFKIVCGDRLALTPHLGWNSWYVWENHVTDAIMRSAAEAMVSSGLRDHGFMYVNIDDCWAVKPGSADPSLGGAPRDAQGRVNANQRFPDMKALTDYIHALGLKAGIYTSPGPLTCAGHVGSYQHEEQDARRFAEWGFDFLKYDWCSYGGIAKGASLDEFKKPYQKMGDILRTLDRDVVFNLCQYGMGKVWEWGLEVHGHSWRTAGDLGGSFQGIAGALFRDGFDWYARNELHKHGGPGGWNDPDYLLLGYLSNWQGQTVPTPLTPNEQYSHVSLWCLLAAPLILSGDITRLDEFTLSLLSNDEILDVDQDALGKPGSPVTVKGDLEVWARDLEDGSKAIGLFNRGEMETVVTVRWQDLGLPDNRPVRDLWRQQDLGVFAAEYSAPVPRHGVAMIKVKP